MYLFSDRFRFVRLLLLFGHVLFGQLVVESGLSFRFNSPPGSLAHTSIRLYNASSTPQEYRLEKMDMKSDCDSGYTYLPSDSLLSSNASWVEAERYYGQLLPGERTSIKVRVSIPHDFSGPSSRSCIMVESAPVQEEALPNQLSVRVRYAVGMLYRNPFERGKVVLKAQRLDLDTSSGVWSLRYLNAGNVDRIVSSRIRILDLQGKVVYRCDQTPSKGILPNQCRTFEFFSKRPATAKAGSYRMVVLSETDEGEKFGLTKQLDW